MIGQDFQVIDFIGRLIGVCEEILWNYFFSRNGEEHLVITSMVVTGNLTIHNAYHVWASEAHREIRRSFVKMFDRGKVTMVSCISMSS